MELGAKYTKLEAIEFLKSRGITELQGESIGSMIEKIRAHDEAFADAERLGIIRPTNSPMKARERERVHHI